MKTKKQTDKKALTVEGGKAVTGKIIAALKEEFGPDLSVIISIAKTDPDGKMSVVCNIEAVGRHIKAFVVNLCEMVERTK